MKLKQFKVMCEDSANKINLYDYNNGQGLEVISVRQKSQYDIFEVKGWFLDNSTTDRIFVGLDVF